MMIVIAIIVVVAKSDGVGYTLALASILKRSRNRLSKGDAVAHESVLGRWIFDLWRSVSSHLRKPGPQWEKYMKIVSSHLLYS